MKPSWIPRRATTADIPILKELIEESAKTLQAAVYSAAQIKAALGPVFGVDEQMIEDQTYYVVEKESLVVGCGGWSFREALFGGRAADAAPPKRLNPKTDAARVRAFFVSSKFARQGIGSVIMRECEQAIQDSGFQRGEISATLVGEPLYRVFGYKTTEYYEIPLTDNEPMKVARMVKTYTAPTANR